MKELVRRCIIPFCVAAAGLAADRLTKLWIITEVASLPGEERVIWDGVLSLLYTENRGAAFGILKDSQWMFIVIGLIACIGMLVLLAFWRQRRRWVSVAVAMVFAGALGNLIDRFTEGFVVDFIYISLIDFAVFNVADILVVCGTLLLAVFLVFFYDKDKGEADTGVADDS